MLASETLPGRNCEIKPMASETLPGAIVSEAHSEVSAKQRRRDDDASPVLHAGIQSGNAASGRCCAHICYGACAGIY